MSKKGGDLQAVQRKRPLCSAFKSVRQPFARLSFGRMLGFGERQLADLFISKHT